MTPFKSLLPISALCLASGYAAAIVYPLEASGVADLAGLTIPMTATGTYDDATGLGTWSLTADLAALGQTTVTLDQNFTIDSTSGLGYLSLPYACSGQPDPICSGLSSSIEGPLVADPTPISAGQYTFTLLGTQLGTVVFDVLVGSNEPGVFVSLSIPDTTLECVEGGAQVSANANISLINDATLESVVWSVDGQPYANAEAFSEFLPLGQHTLSVTATISSGATHSAQTVVTISDTTAPVITAYFSNSRTGDTITTIDSKRTSLVSTNFRAEDACDANPDVQGFGGLSLKDGQRLRIQGKRQVLSLKTSELEMLVKATDGSGNSSEVTQTLYITP